MSNQKRVLSLDQAFEPFLKMPYTETLSVQKMDFPSGCEPHISLLGVSEYDRTNGLILSCRIASTKDIIDLLLTTDALRRCGVKDITLVMPYLPFARQDRIMVYGEPLSIKVFADLVNAQNYTNVWVFDPHSEVGPALINNCKYINNHRFVEQVLKDKSGYLLVTPDAGAYKKIFGLAQYLNYKDDIVLCNKIRNVENGKITGTFIPVDDFQGLDLYIIDDICSRGGTFIALAQELKKRNCGEINLVVSHFENSADLMHMRDSGIAKIYKTNSMNDFQNDFVENIPLQLLPSRL